MVLAAVLGLFLVTTLVPGTEGPLATGVPLVIFALPIADSALKMP